jgi:hypothetical protein
VRENRAQLQTKRHAAVSSTQPLITNLKTNAVEEMEKWREILKTHINFYFRDEIGIP